MGKKTEKTKSEVYAPDLIRMLEVNIQWRLEHKGTKGTRYTASYFPEPNLFWVSKYGRFRWGVFYDHRYFGYTLTKHYQEALAEIKQRGGWQSLEDYEAWRDARKQGE
jgi:hypothetical protein